MWSEGDDPHKDVDEGLDKLETDLALDSSALAGHALAGCAFQGVRWFHGFTFDANSV
jgi:hypothetical protein